MAWLAAPLGPLAGPECRRAMRVGWLPWARVLVAVPALLWLSATCWIWWLVAELDVAYRPTKLLSLGLLVAASTWLLAVLAIMPALTCGALSGSQSRAAGEVLLATPVSALQIIVGRLSARLCQAACLTAAALPVVLFFCGACGVSWWRCLTFVLLLASVAWGSGGLTLGLGASTRRARDALLSVSLLLAATLLGHRFLGEWVPPAAREWLVALDPFSSLGLLFHGGAAGGTARSICCWILLGTVGIAWAAWRLRPVVLGVSRDPLRRKNRRRPPLGEGNPLLWKDLYIERLGGLHRLTAGLGLLLSLLLSLGGLAFAAAAAYARWIADGSDLRDSLIVAADSAQIALGTPLSLLVQWALGVRAAVSVAAERERGTWGSLLVSPLEGRQIVWGKILASAYALRWLLAGAAIWWTGCCICGALRPTDYVSLLVNTSSGCVLMLAVGVWAGIGTTGVNRALLLTAGVWLASLAIFRIMAAVFGALAMGLYLLAFALWSDSIATSSGTPPLSPAVVALVFSAATMACEALLRVTTAWLVAWLCCRSFDRLAGRAPVPRLARARDARRDGAGGALPSKS